MGPPHWVQGESLPTSWPSSPRCPEPEGLIQACQGLLGDSLSLWLQLNGGWGWTKVSCPLRAWGCEELGLNMGRTENRTGRQKEQTPGDSPCYLDSKKPQYRHTGNKRGWEWPWRLRAGLPSLLPLCHLQFSSVAQSCLTLCHPTNRSTPGLPVHHQLPQ